MSLAIGIEWRKVAATLIIVTIVIVAYGIFTSGYEGFSSILTPRTIASLAFLLAGWFISAIRLRLLVDRVYGFKIKLSDSLKARFLGGLLANITPSAIGGEPARAAYLRKVMDRGIEELYALSLYEVYYDVILVNMMAFIPAFFYLPVSLPVVLVSSFMIASWIYIGFFIKQTSSNSPKGFIGWLSKKFPKFTERYLKFSTRYAEISSRISLNGKILIAVLTLSYNTLWGVAAWFFTDSSSILQCIMAYYFMMSMGSLPTPGGSISSEYALSLVLPPSTVVSYRTLFYYSTILIGLVILARELD
ncbi:MAG: lysylphosphatidylglycerol synthase domain-containing protein [Thermosphaera sp.]